MTETRAEKAQRLVDEGRVTMTGTCDQFRNARVESGRHIYFPTLYANGHFWCSCPWGSFHSHTTDLCAHALAVKLAAEKEN